MLLQTSFDPSALVYWRKRIAASDRSDGVFDAVAEVIAQTGILRGRRKRCVDSTVFDDAVATQDRHTAGGRDPQGGPGGARRGGGDRPRVPARLLQPGKPDIDWDDRPPRRTWSAPW